LHAIWVFVTDCGDSAVTVPLALLTLTFLVVSGQQRCAVYWTLATGGSAVAIAALKLAFGACGQRVPLAHIVSPSGHAAMSAAVYGSLALLVGTRLSPERRYILYLVTSVAVVAIAVSRLTLERHTLPEVALGLLVGAGGVALFGVALRRQEAPALPLGWLMVCGAAVVVAMHGTHWLVEPVLRRMAQALRLAAPLCS
jgi:membrane-associated phospholipid phosphatase